MSIEQATVSTISRLWPVDLASLIHLRLVNQFGYEFGLPISTTRQNAASRIEILRENRARLLLRRRWEKGPVGFGRVVLGRDLLLHETSHERSLEELLVVFLTRVSSWLLPLCPCNMLFLIRRLTCNLLLGDIRQWWSTGLVVVLLQPAGRHHLLRKMQGNGIA